MKKVLSLIAILGALTGTASAAPYYLPQPAGGALTPYDWQPVYSIEGVYNFSDKNQPDTYGARLSFSLYNNAEGSVRHQFSINAGYECGSDTVNFNDLGRNINVDLTRIPFTLGYDVNLALSKSVFLDLGAKAGYALGEVEHEHISEDLNGFTFALGAGIKVQCSDSIYVKLGYEFNRTFFHAKDSGSRHYNYGQHGIVFGVGATF